MRALIVALESRMPKSFARIVSVMAGCAAAGIALAQTPPPAGIIGPPHPSQPPGQQPPGQQVQAGHPDSAPHAPAPVSQADIQKALHALGFLLARNLEPFALSPAEYEAVRQGFGEGYRHPTDSKDAEALVPQIQALERERTLKSGAAFAARMATQPGAETTPSGLVYIKVKEGSGQSPTRADRVKVMYEGRLTNGVVFDSTELHGGNPATFSLGGVMACWTEALQKMKPGGKARIVCPAAIAYGERAQPPKIRPNSTLDFNVELLEVLPPVAPPAAGPGAPGTGAGAAPGTGAPPVTPPTPPTPPSANAPH
jgi:FKBP-type peptidyl-prolyl cis-trans isomerase FkpA